LRCDEYAGTACAKGAQNLHFHGTAAALYVAARKRGQGARHLAQLIEA
jgi:hypothetical protein